jgi:branched-chain amino acid transport system ATP-binding protein
MGECPGIADRAYILQPGRLLMQGSAAETKVNPDGSKACPGL